MKHFRRHAAAVLCALAFGAQAQNEPGITGKSIRIGLFAPLSGSGMAYGFDVLNAARMWYDKVNREGGVVHDHTEVKRLLDLVRTSCKGQVEAFGALCQSFNKATSDGRRMQVYSDLLGKAIRSMIEVKEEKDIDSLFSGGKTSALTQAITGLDDFELVSFLVVQGEA